MAGAEPVDTIVYAVEAAVLLAGIVYVGWPWMRARRLGVPVPLSRVVSWRIGGVPPDLIIDAYAAQRSGDEKLPLVAFQQAWLANRERITNAAELARYTRERAMASGQTPR